MKPRVLVISNTCFSKSESNGRTLGNFFLNWPKESLAQFYIQNSHPDFEYCSNFFRITDNQALKALVKNVCSKGEVKEWNQTKKIQNVDTKISRKKNERNAFTMMIRNVVWQSDRWKKCGFDEWVSKFHPDIVLLQAGDCAFMFRLAVKTAKEQKAKLVIYNSEGYYFKNYDYFRSKGLSKILYPLFYEDLKKALKKAYMESSYVIYSCDELKEDYDKEFKVPSDVIYTATDIKTQNRKITNKHFTVSYCGNLGVGRHKGLIDIADTLQRISPNLYLDVYGKASSYEIEIALSECRGIHYHGLISYQEVVEVLYKSDLIVHTESYDPFYIKDLKYAFSTKIADSLGCGTCFLVYAPNSCACYKYLEKYEAAFVVNNKDDLNVVLKLIIENSDIRGQYLSNAQKLVNMNHQLELNIKKFEKILTMVMR